MTSISDSMGPEGVGIHVRATFLSLRFLPSPFALGHNNLNPVLHLYPDRVELKSVKKVEFAYTDIVEVCTMKAIATRNISFKLKKGMYRHTANIMDDETFLSVLTFLEEKGVPLTPKANKQLEKVA